jgi:NADH-quinone oxidoreductase subunit L
MGAGTVALMTTTAPLGAFILALLFFQRQRMLAAAVTIGSAIVSLAGSVWLLLSGGAPEPIVQRWLPSESAELAFGFLLDGQNLLFGVVVAAIALAVQVYSLGYMAGDRGWSRYYAFMGLFAWSMLSFVYAANLLQMFIFWELVGLASFLLIGFWYQKPEAAAAARKAFVMTRIGDVGLFIGLILLFQQTGTMDIALLNQSATLALIPAGLAPTIAVLFFCGVVGKSAQFPLHTWLPDAMEGPTPVSALLHSATMVAAGVFLFARFHQLFQPIFELVLAIALLTALLAATMAMVQRDIKRVLAYSSISQLGFMLLGLAAGSLHAGVYHLTTHAFFKALLFLCAGAYIHHSGSNDMVAIGRSGARSQRLTSMGLVVGAAALSGLPLLSGFWSKEAILAALSATRATPVLLGAYLASFLTAYYSFRMVFLVLRPNPRSAALDPAADAAASAPLAADGAPGAGAAAGLGRDPADQADASAGQADHGHAAHGLGGWAMAAAILGLTVATLILCLPLWGDTIARLLGAFAVHPDWAHMAPPIAVALSGVAIAWLEFGRKGASQIGFIRRVKPLHTLFAQGWYVDRFYAAVVQRLLDAVTRACALFESKGLDGLADDVADGTVGGGRVVSRAQGGRLQFYIGASVLFVALACYLLGTV